MKANRAGLDIFQYCLSKLASDPSEGREEEEAKASLNIDLLRIVHAMTAECPNIHHIQYTKYTLQIIQVLRMLNLQEEVTAKERVLEVQKAEVVRLTETAATLRSHAGKELADESSQALLGELKAQNAMLEARLAEQLTLTGPLPSTAGALEQQEDEAEKSSHRGSEEGVPKTPGQSGKVENWKQQASELQKENRDLRKQISQLEASNPDAR